MEFASDGSNFEEEVTYQLNFEHLNPSKTFILPESQAYVKFSESHLAPPLSPQP